MNYKKHLISLAALIISFFFLTGCPQPEGTNASTPEDDSAITGSNPIVGSWIRETWAIDNYEIENLGSVRWVNGYVYVFEESGRFYDVLVGDCQVMENGVYRTLSNTEKVLFIEYCRTHQISNNPLNDRGADDLNYQYLDGEGSWSCTGGQVTITFERQWGVPVAEGAQFTWEYEVKDETLFMDGIKVVHWAVKENLEYPPEARSYVPVTQANHPLLGTWSGRNFYILESTGNFMPGRRDTFQFNSDGTFTYTRMYLLRVKDSESDRHDATDAEKQEFVALYKNDIDVERMFDYYEISTAIFDKTVERCGYWYKTSETGIKMVVSEFYPEYGVFVSEENGEFEFPEENEVELRFNVGSSQYWSVWAVKK